MTPFSDAEQAFIAENLHQEPAKLMLQAHRFPDLPVAALVQQIQARQKAKEKLPEWYANLNLIFPANISVEQSSSEQTAAFKAGLVSGRLLIDLTGGFGIDSFFFSRKMKEVYYVERNQELAGIACLNFKTLGAENIHCLATGAEDFLTSFNGKADYIYLDPARRSAAHTKVHLLEDCEPDVLQLLPLLLAKSKKVLLKASPMLDIDLAINQLKQVKQVLVVAVENECKEVLYLLDQHQHTDPEITAFNLTKNNPPEPFIFRRSGEETAEVVFADPETYLYEPHAAVLKAGGFRSIAQAYQLKKLHRNSHLYTSQALISDFPGRIFKVQTVVKYQKKELLKLLPEKKANITVRNFPETVAAIRKQTGIKEGGNVYLFATTDMHNKPVVLVCKKLMNNDFARSGHFDEGETTGSA